MSFCPNVNSQEWKDTVKAVGENVAQYLWEKNNGNSLELTPDGRPSELYRQLFEQTGDPIQAIKRKAGFYSIPYISSHGDWTLASHTFKGAIVNGEPVISSTGTPVQEGYKPQQAEVLFNLNQPDSKTEFQVRTLNAVNSFFEAINVPIQFVDTIIGPNGNVVDKALAVADFVNQTVNIISDMERRPEAWNALPEEAAHFWFRLLNNHSMKQQFLDHPRTKKLVKELGETKYGEVYSDFLDNEQLENALHEEAIGKLISDAIKKIESKTATEEDFSIYKKFVEWVNSIIKSFENFFKNSDVLFDIAAAKILTGDISDLMTSEEVRNLYLSAQGFNDVQVPLSRDKYVELASERIKFFDNLLNKQFKAEKTFRKKTIDKFIKTYKEGGLHQDSKVGKFLKEDENKIPLTFFGKYALMNKYQKTVPLNSKINLDGVKAKELEYINLVREQIIKENPDIKTISTEEFIVLTEHFISEQFPLRIQQLPDKHNNYRLRDILKTDAFIQEMSGTLSGIPMNMTSHNKTGIFLDNVFFKQGWNNVNGHFGENPFAFYSLMNFRQGNVVANLLHEIQSDIIEKLSIPSENTELEPKPMSAMNQFMFNFIVKTNQEARLFYDSIITGQPFGNRIFEDLKHNIDLRFENAVTSLEIAERSIETGQRSLDSLYSFNRRVNVIFERYPELINDAFDAVTEHEWFSDPDLDMDYKVKNEVFTTEFENKFDKAYKELYGTDDMYSQHKFHIIHILRKAKLRKNLGYTKLKLKEQFKNFIYDETARNRGIIKFARFQRLKMNSAVKYLEKIKNINYKSSEKLYNNIASQFNILKDMFIEASQNVESGDLVSAFNQPKFLEFAQYYLVPTLHHAVLSHIKKYGKNSPLYFSSGNTTMLTQNSFESASLYAGPEESFSGNEQEKNRIYYDILTSEDYFGEVAWMRNYSDESLKSSRFMISFEDFLKLTNNNPIKFLRESNKKQALNDLKNGFYRKTGKFPNIGIIYKIFSGLKGIKVKYEKVNEFNDNTSAYKVDLSGYTLDSPVLFNLSNEEAVPFGEPVEPGREEENIPDDVSPETVSPETETDPNAVQSVILEYGDKNLRDFINKHVIEGLKPIQQYKLVTSLGLHAIRNINTGMSVNETLDIYFDNDLNEILELVQDDEEHVRILKTVKKNRQMVKNKVIQYIAKISDAKIFIDDEGGFDIEMEDVAETRENTNYSEDYSITINHKNTASGRLKRFFASIMNMVPDVNGTMVEEENMFGLAEIIPFDVVYNTVQGVVSGIPASYTMMKEAILASSETKPWLREVISQLDGADQIIKNEFVKNMTKHPIEMKFLTWSFDSETGQYKMRILDSNSSAVEKVILSEWKSNMRGKDMFLPSEYEGETYYDPQKLQPAIDRFLGWQKSYSKSKSLTYIKPIENIENWGTVTIKALSEGKPEDLIRGLIVKEGSKIKEGQQFVLSTKSDIKYVIERRGDKFEIISTLDQYFSEPPSPEDLREWFDSLGISLSENTMKDLYEGKVYFDISKKRVEYGDLFREGGPLDHFVKKVLSPKLTGEVPIETINPMDDTIVKNLAKRETRHAINKFGTSFRAGSKTVATNTNNNFLINRMRDMKNNFNRTLENVMKNPFGKHNFILSQFARDENGTIILDKNEAFQNTNLFYMSLESLKRYGAKSRDNREMHKLSPLEQEVVRLNLFAANASVVSINGKDSRRVVMPLLTMSDKTRVMLIEFYARVFNVSSDGKISNDTAEEIFKHIVKPEIERMESAENGIVPDVKGYNAHRFYLLPFLNNIDKIFLNGKINPAILRTDSKLRQDVINAIIEEVDNESNNKLQEWEKLGITNVEKKAKGGVVKTNLISAPYFKKTGYNVKRTATDYILNNWLLNTSTFQMFAGDPALYGKGTESDVKVFDNIGKRLAMLIAPGSELAESFSPNDLVRYAFIQDNNIDSEYADYFQKTFGFDYRRINSGDAQEYTTWKEHLRVLRQEGKISPEEFDKTEKLLSKGLDLPPDLLQVIIKPMKPVYVGSTFDGNFVEKRYYIKSSSIPLIPQLTRIFEIDKLRLKMESKEGADRVAFESAVKVGIGKNLDKVFEGNKVVDNLEFTSVVELPRSGFRIQQEIPNKDKKYINDGTQQRSMLFLNFDNINGFVYKGSPYSGRELKNIYNERYKKLYQLKHKQLMEELTLDGKLNVEALREALMNEAISRGFSENALEALELTTDRKGNKVFSMPLWFSPYSEKFEALLNSIVTNRVLKHKFPGMSLVLASPSGFKLKSVEDVRMEDGILLTNRFDGNSLKPMRHSEDGKEMLPAQVMVPQRFYKDLSEYMDESGKLDTSKIPDGMLELFGYRIPTQGHSSMAYIEVVGFLPESMGDIIIAPAEFVNQMGSDFDVDKLYAFRKTDFDFDGQNYVLSEETRNLFKRSRAVSFKNNLYSALRKLKSEDYIKQEQTTGEVENIYAFAQEVLSSFEKNASGTDIVSLLKHYNITPDFADTLEHLIDSYSEQMLDEFIDELVLKNDILEIHYSVLRNPDKTVQRQVFQPLEYGELQKKDGTGLDETISRLKENRNRSLKKSFVPISESYQKAKFQGGTQGKSGTGVFSLAAVFNAAIQSDLASESVILREPYFDEEEQKIVYRPFKIRLFGKRTDGNLASTTIINSKRPKSEVITAFQSASVDNEKQRILEKLNINEITFPVITVMSQLGFSETEIIYLLNQPVIESYVSAYSSVSGSLDGFNPNPEAEARSIALKDFEVSGETSQFPFESISPEEALAMIEGNPVDNLNQKQRALMYLYADLEKYGKMLQKMMTNVNTDSKGVPITITEVTEKAVRIMNMRSHPNFQGISRLVGKFTESEGNVTIDPNTIKGYASVYGILNANNLFSELFPFSDPQIEGVVSEIAALLGVEEDTAQHSSLRKNVYKEIKKYVYSKDLPIYRAEVKDLRQNLLMDTDTNQSLASFLSNIKEISYIRLHPFLSKLKFDLSGKNKGFSYIEYNAASLEDLDESLTHLAFAEMLQDDQTLIGRRNGVNVTPKTLAEDLVAYSFITGGIQEATQFIKYNPIAYLKDTGADGYLRTVDFKNTNVLGISDMLDGYKPTSIFSKQFIQNNPDMVYQLTNDQIINGLKAIDESIKEGTPLQVKEDVELNPEVRFISIKDSKNKIHLFERTQDGLVEIPILGEKKVSEYYPDDPEASSVISENNSNITARPIKITRKRTPGIDKYFQAKNINEALSMINMNPMFRTLSSILRPLIPSDISYSVQDIVPDRPLPSGHLIPGRYEHIKKRVLMNPKIRQSFGFEITLLHEAVHVVTANVIGNIMSDPKGNYTRAEKKFFMDMTDIYDHITNYYQKNKDSLNFSDFETEFQSDPNEIKRNIEYGLSDMFEMLSVGMTEGGFQKFLNTIVYNDERKTVLDKIVDAVTEFIRSIAQTLNIEINDNSALKALVEKTITYIHSENFRVPNRVFDQSNNLSVSRSIPLTKWSEFDEISDIADNLNESPLEKIKKLCR